MLSLPLSVPVIGIVRGISKELFTPLMQESFAAGLQAIEVTLNTKDSLAIIEAARPRVAGDKLLGAGTVCSMKDARRAIDAGALFLVTPNFDKDVIHYATSRSIPVVSGALTPTEIHAAWSQGAAMIKVFPCSSMGGPNYIRELRGPFDTIPLAAVGGVTLENTVDYLGAGADAVGVSTALFGREALATANLREIGDNVQTFIAAVNRYQAAPQD